MGAKLSVYTHMCYNVWKNNFDYVLYVTKIYQYINNHK